MADKHPGDIIQKKALRFEKPKIMFFDETPEIVTAMIAEGFNVAQGSFGSPYITSIDEHGMRALLADAELSHHTEQEIIFINLWRNPLKQPKTKPPQAGETGWFVEAKFQIIDPRPRPMRDVKQAFDRIYNNGGTFVVFTECPRFWKVFVGSPSPNGFRKQKDENVSIWEFLDDLKYLEARKDEGSEIQLPNNPSNLAKQLSPYVTRGQFDFTIVPRLLGWDTLAENKFGEIVAVAGRGRKRGLVLILPGVDDRLGLIRHLLFTVLPTECPHLFPYHGDQLSWAQTAPYEIPEVLHFREQQTEIAERARVEHASIEAAIEAERKAEGWQLELITGYDDVLVNAVTKALGLCGFKEIKKVDEERDTQGKQRREDLQILDNHDIRPVLIADVKGILGLPDNGHVFQADHHATLRIREWNDARVNPLTIINHQRKTPPLDRQNRTVFTSEHVEAAIEKKMGLLTSWDLFRLVRNVEKHNWSFSNVEAIFYSVGRIEIVPEHYQFIGDVVRIFPNAGAIRIEIKSGDLKSGDKIAIEFDVLFEEAAIDSIRIGDDPKPVEIATSGQTVGILWDFKESSPQEGLRVFRLERSGARPSLTVFDG